MILYSYIKWKGKSYDWCNWNPILITFTENTYRKLGMQQKLDKLAVTGEVSYDRGISACWSWPSGNVLYVSLCLCYLNEKQSKSSESKSHEKQSLKARQTPSSHMWIVVTEFYFVFFIFQYAEHMFLQLVWFSVCMNKSNNLSLTLPILSKGRSWCSSWLHSYHCTKSCHDLYKLEELGEVGRQYECLTSVRVGSVTDYSLQARNSLKLKEWVYFINARLCSALPSERQHSKLLLNQQLPNPSLGCQWKHGSYLSSLYRSWFSAGIALSDIFGSYKENNKSKSKQRHTSLLPQWSTHRRDTWEKVLGVRKKHGWLLLLEQFLSETEVKSLQLSRKGSSSSNHILATLKLSL